MLAAWLLRALVRQSVWLAASAGLLHVCVLLYVSARCCAGSLGLAGLSQDFVIVPVTERMRLGSTSFLPGDAGGCRALSVGRAISACLCLSGARSIGFTHDSLC